MPKIHVKISGWAPTGRSVGQHTFAIGDVHGCSANLRALHEAIIKTVENETAGTVRLIHLGDLIDRGADSLGALKIVADGIGHHRIQQINLTGNHEQMLLRVLREDNSAEEMHASFEIWSMNGGSAVVEELGIDLSSIMRSPQGGHHGSSDAWVDRLRSEISVGLGPNRLAMLRDMKTFVRDGDVIFVHAGVSPYQDLSEFLSNDWTYWPRSWSNESCSPLWIRGEFLHAAAPLPENVFVVHGHTPSRASLDHQKHRLGLDAHSYRSGVVLAAELKEDQFRIYRATAQE